MGPVGKNGGFIENNSLKVYWLLLGAFSLARLCTVLVGAHAVDAF